MQRRSDRTMEELCLTRVSNESNHFKKLNAAEAEKRNKKAVHPMRYQKWYFKAALVLGVLAPAIFPVHAQTITSFDVPGSTGTVPPSINPAGEITGLYRDSTHNDHGFVRDGRGTITSF